MNWAALHLAWILLGAGLEAQKTALDSPANVRLYHSLLQWLGDAVGRTGRSSAGVQAARELGRVEAYFYGQFPCNLSEGRSHREPPSSVHELRPGDIDVVAAMGDSLTAGLGVFASNILQIVVENRGASFSGGGQADWRRFLTLPNILKVFNPKLFGYASTDAYVFEERAEFNVASSGAMSRDMPFMAKVLIKRIRSDPRVNVKKHWKLVTLMIGANDFCTDMCYLSQPAQTLINHKRDLIQVLRSLRDSLPRTVVSILPPPHLRVLVEINARSDFCNVMVDFECLCLFGLVYRRYRQYFYDIMTSWQELEEEIAQYDEFQTDNFTVIVQSFTKNLTFPTTVDGLSDMTYLSTDCFHLSEKGDARAANALWNNLMQPVGQKFDNWYGLYEEFVCPTEERPFIATYKNSREKQNRRQNR